MSDSPDPRRLLGQALDQAGAVIAGVRPGQMEGPTPCTAFDVRTLVGHLLFAARRVGQVGRREQVTTDGPAVVGLADDEWAPAFAEAASQAVASWAGWEELTEDIVLPFGTFPAEFVVWMYVLEHLAHAWDLAVAVGSTVELDEALAETALPVARQMIVPEFRGGEEMPFGPIVEVPADAPAVDRLAGFLGRDPAFRASVAVGGAA
jgi:uncharacterized protein (TIGR03086 family)